MTFLFVLFFTCAVFSQGTEIIKRAGETVTLYMNQTTYCFRNFLWTFGPFHPVTVIAIVTNGEVTLVNGTRFKNRLSTDVETGSITISILTRNDTGKYLVQLLTPTRLVQQKFHLIVLDNSFIPVNVLEGCNVTLDTGLTELQKDYFVIWTQGPNFGGQSIAQWKNFIISIAKGFEGILQLDPHNGSLTFIGVTQNYAGYYCVKTLWKDLSYIVQQFLISVFEPVSTPHISYSQEVERCFLVCSVKNAPELTLSWYREKVEIIHINDSDMTQNLSLSLEIDRENEGIHSCVAANPVSQEAVTVNSTQLCPPHDPKSKPYEWITGGVGVLVVLGIIALIVWKPCGRKERATNCFSMENTEEQMQSQSCRVSEESHEIAEQRGLLRN